MKVDSFWDWCALVDDVCVGSVLLLVSVFGAVKALRRRSRSASDTPAGPEDVIVLGFLGAMMVAGSDVFPGKAAAAGLLWSSTKP